MGSAATSPSSKRGARGGAPSRPDVGGASGLLRVAPEAEWPVALYGRDHAVQAWHWGGDSSERWRARQGMVICMMVGAIAFQAMGSAWFARIHRSWQTRIARMSEELCSQRAQARAAAQQSPVPQSRGAPKKTGEQDQSVRSTRRRQAVPRTSGENASLDLNMAQSSEGP